MPISERRTTMFGLVMLYNASGLAASLASRSLVPVLVTFGCTCVLVRLFGDEIVFSDGK
jgi:hypothetical protein